jgi:hypothetical protein
MDLVWWLKTTSPSPSLFVQTADTMRFNIFEALRFVPVRALVGNGYFDVFKANGVDVDIRPNTKLCVGGAETMVVFGEHPAPHRNRYQPVQ